MRSPKGRKSWSASPRDIATCLKAISVVVLVACGPGQLFIDDALINLTCTITAIISSIATVLYVFNVGRIRRAPLSSLMVLGFNISALSGALLIQTASGISLVYNLMSPIQTFLALAATQMLIIVVHAIYLRSRLVLGFRFWLKRRVVIPLRLLSAPSNGQLWLFGLVGCAATVLSAHNYSGEVEYGNVSEKFLFGYITFAVAPFFIPMRSYLMGDEASAGGSWPMLAGYALLLIAVAMVNNARATFSSGFLTLALCLAVAVLSGNLRLTRKRMLIGLVLVGLGIPFFSAISDLATAMVIARDERSNVSSMELIRITLSNFQDKALIDDRRRRDAAILGGDYNENYVSNPVFARFVYTKFTDVNMTNALALSDDQAAEIRKSTWSRIIAMLPTPLLNFLQINVNKYDLGFSSGDIYSYIARGLELGGYTTGSEIPDGITIFGVLFWPVLAVLVLAQFIIYDAFSEIRAGLLNVSAVALLNVVPIFTLGVMQESVSNQITSIFRGIPQLILLYVLISAATSLVLRPLAFATRRAIAPREAVVME